MEKQKAYVIESPEGLMLWFTCSVRRAKAIEKFMSFYVKGYLQEKKVRKWPYWNLKGYKTVAVGKL